MKTVRILFEKTGRAVYISHLDLMRVMQRTLRRAGLPVWYTQGFNPHIYLTFALPLSLGYEGRREPMDFRLLEDMPFDEAARRITEAAPDGIRALSAAEPVMEPTDIMWADYEISFVSDAAQPREAFLRFLGRDGILAEKKSKKGVQAIDLKPLFSASEVAGEGLLTRFSLRARAGTAVNLNPALLLEAFARDEGCSILQKKVVRTAILNTNFEEFI
ncbi:MAG TPA: DUF2344 domain-containing protein [Candidatus Fimivivens faecavium]|nr:DUF2344 domain-containing protein [Candidatus Fimivivens faecavium]